MRDENFRRQFYGDFIELEDTRRGHQNLRKFALYRITISNNVEGIYGVDFINLIINILLSIDYVILKAPEVIKFRKLGNPIIPQMETRWTLSVIGILDFSLHPTGIDWESLKVNNRSFDLTATALLKIVQSLHTPEMVWDIKNYRKNKKCVKN